MLINDGNWLGRHGVGSDGSLRWDSRLAGSTTWDTVVSGLAGSVVVVLTAGGSHGVLRAGHVSLNQGKDLLDQLNCVGSLKERGIDGSSSLSFHVEEISLVLSVSLNFLSDLRKFVVGDEQVLAINGVVVKI